MIKIYKDSIVYVCCPAYNKTGGTELAHQLVYEINNNGGNAKIAYYGHAEDLKINEAFLKYTNIFCELDNVDDNSKNILVVPEIATYFLKRFTFIQKAVWWMSVDNYTKRNSLFTALKYYGIARTFRFIIKGEVKIYPHKFEENCIHFYQSVYARDYLKARKIKESYQLTDYINEVYFVKKAENKKENIVLYNPQKGIKFTKKIIERADNLEFIPIINMTNEEVRSILQKSKVYIDFGNHPGKDRFPREAASSGCCVITGKNGAANNSDDIPIDSKYKFEVKQKNISLIINEINNCIINYDSERNNFNNYQEKIKNEYNQFVYEVKKMFIYKESESNE